MADSDRQFLISLNNGFDRSVVLLFLHAAINERARPESAYSWPRRAKLDLAPDDRPLLARAMRTKRLEQSAPVVP
jgi:hypothetical protein